MEAHDTALLSNLAQKHSECIFIAVLNPSSRKAIGAVPDMGEQETEAAIQAAYKAFQSWKKTTAKVYNLSISSLCSRTGESLWTCTYGKYLDMKGNLEICIENLWVRIKDKGTLNSRPQKCSVTTRFIINE